MKNFLKKYAGYIVVAIVFSVLSSVITLSIVDSINTFKRDIIIWTTICLFVAFIIFKIVMFFKKKKE